MSQTLRLISTAMKAAKYLPTVRKAVPAYVWPLLGLALLIKLVPIDFGIDEALLAICFALIAWRRPGLLKALWREAQYEMELKCVVGIQ